MELENDPSCFRTTLAFARRQEGEIAFNSSPVPVVDGTHNPS